MTREIDSSQFRNVEDVVGEDDEETRQLRTLAERATAFMLGFGWCCGIRKRRFAFGVADIVGVFLFEIDAASEEYRPRVLGDCRRSSPAYLVTDDAPDGRAALEGYIFEMRRWASAARLGVPVRELIPVNAPATPEWAENLDRRLNFLEKWILPRCDSES